MRNTIVICEQCGRKDRYQDLEARYEDGWLEVYEGNESSCYDFCSRSCLVDYYTGREEES